jgi:spore coat protein CotH
MRFVRFLAKEQFSAVEIIGYGWVFIAFHDDHYGNAAVIWVLTVIAATITSIIAKEREA